MGHLLTSEGLLPDPQKVQAVIDMPKPDGVQAVQRFLGFVNYLAKFLPHISDVSEPLRRLTDKDAVWCWMPKHDAAIDSIKQLLTSPVLRYYDVKEEVTMHAYSVMPAKLAWELPYSKMGSQWLLPQDR